MLAQVRFSATLQIQKVAHFIFLGLHVLEIFFVAANLDGKAFRDLQSEPFQPRDFFWVVGQQADLANAQVNQDLGTGTVIA